MLPDKSGQVPTCWDSRNGTGTAFIPDAIGGNVGSSLSHTVGGTYKHLSEMAGRMIITVSFFFVNYEMDLLGLFSFRFF